VDPSCEAKRGPSLRWNCLWCEKYTLILSLLITIARFFRAWSLRKRFVTGMPYIWNWRSACVHNWSKCGREISTPAVCDILSMWSCCPYNLLARCVCYCYITLSLHYFENWDGECGWDTIELNGMTKLKFCVGVFRLLLFTYPVSLLCLFLHIPKSLCSVEGCGLLNIYRQVRALKIDASLCKVRRIFFVIDVTCITCFRVCYSMHTGDNTKQLRNWIVLHLRSCMWNNSFKGPLLDTIRRSHGSHCVRFVMLGLRVIVRIHRAVLLIILFIASFDSREEVRYFLVWRASTQALGPTRHLLGAQGLFFTKGKVAEAWSWPRPIKCRCYVWLELYLFSV
jgi:hypothetical protein